MKSINKPQLLATIVLIAVALLIIYFLSAGQSNPSGKGSLEQRQKDFVHYVDTAQLQNKTLVFEDSGPLCVGSRADEQADCTLSKTFIYKLDGNYRDNGKEIFAYLKSKGFDFQKGDKYKSEVEKKFNNHKLADNLSNSEPIIVDLYSAQDIRVRVNLGDRDRTMPYVNGQAFDRLTTEQLIVGLQFYNP